MKTSINGERLILYIFFGVLIISALFGVFRKISFSSKEPSEITDIRYSQVGPSDEITVEGFLVDQSGEPLIGGTLVLKGTSKGTISDIDGHFNFQFSNENTTTAPVLEFSYTGYKKLSFTLEVEKGNHVYAKFIMKETW